MIKSIRGDGHLLRDFKAETSPVDGVPAYMSKHFQVADMPSKAQVRGTRGANLSVHLGNHFSRTKKSTKTPHTLNCQRQMQDDPLQQHVPINKHSHPSSEMSFPRPTGPHSPLPSSCFQRWLLFATAAPLDYILDLDLWPSTQKATSLGGKWWIELDRFRWFCRFRNTDIDAQTNM